MSDDREVTNWHLLYALREQNKKLEEISEDIKEQNGRVRKLENDMIRIKSFWSVGVVTAGLFADSIKHKLGM
jgi:hypothetical protein